MLKKLGSFTRETRDYLWVPYFFDGLTDIYGRMMYKLA
jgi:hypothetical protein